MNLLEVKDNPQELDWKLILSLLLEEAVGEDVETKLQNFDAEHVIGIRRMFANELEAVSELHKTSLRVLRTSEFTSNSLRPLRKVQEQIDSERRAIHILSNKEEMKIHVAKVSDINPELLFDVEETDVYEETQNYNAKRMIYEANMEKLTKTEQELGEGKWISYEASLSNVEECMNCPSKIKKYSNDIVSSKWFDRFILFVIILNCVTLALDNPQERGTDLSNFIRTADYIFIGIFVVEMCLKISAYGFVKEDNSYLSDAWNVMDFVIVMTGLLSLLMEILETPTENVNALRAFRVLRPLRTITQFPGLRVLVNAVLESLTLLGNTVIIMGFFFLVFGIAALSLFKGALKYRCYTKLNGTYTIDPGDVDPPRFCSEVGRQCASGYECLKLGENPHSGVVSFDDIGYSILNLFVFVTLEGWSDAMYYLADVSGQVMSILFFLPVIGLGSFILINLTLAVILSSFRQSKERQYKVIESKLKLSKRRTELQQLRRNILKMSSSSRDSFDSPVNNAQSKWDNVRLKIKTAAILQRAGQKKTDNVVKNSKLKNCKLYFLQIWASIVSSHNRFRKMCLAHKYYAYFNHAIVVCIILNSIAFALDYHNMPKDYAYTLEMINLVFTWIFILELVVMIIIHNPYNYFKDWSRVFDFFLVLTSVVNMVIQNMEISANDGAKSLLEALVVFRVARALRIFRVARQLKSMATVLDVMTRSVGSFSYIFLLLLLFMFIFTILGMQLFSGYELQNRNTCNDFGLCFITVFQVLTGENWNSLLEDFAEAGASLGGVFMYFLFWIFAGQYILLNLILAVIMEQFGNMEEEEAKQKHSSPGGLRKTLSRITSSFGKFSSPIKTEGELSGFLSKRCFVCDPKGFVVKKAQKLASNKMFEYSIMLLIAISSIVLAAEGPQDVEPSPFMKALDIFFNVAFAIEAVVKIVAMGFVTPKNSYLRDAWNVLDFTIVVAGVLTIMFDQMEYEGSNVSFMKVLRMLRVLRPLKAISRNRGMQLVVRCLIASMASIGNVLIVAFVLFFAFAVAGYALFGGKFYYCNDPDFPPRTSRYGVLNSSHVAVQGNSSVSTLNKWVVEPCAKGYYAKDGTEREWVNAEFHFDNFYMSVITLFVMFSLEGWPDILWHAMDVTDVDVSPEPGAFASYGFVYFIFFIFLASMLLLNLFTGVIFESYLKQKRQMDTEGISMFITPEQQEWIDKCKVYMSMKKPARKFDPPTHPMRFKMYCIVTKPLFENVIFALIILNLIQQASTWDTEPQIWTEWQYILTFVFTFIFCLEAIMKIYGLEWKPYWDDPWNKFDFILVVFSLFDIAISVIDLNFSFFRVLRVGRVLGRLLRIIRVSRIARLAKAFSGLRTIGATLSMSLYSLINIATLLFLLYFIYAVLGVKAFGLIKEGSYINAQRNFNDFGSAFTYTIVISTGESWNGAMYDAVVNVGFIAVLYFFSFIIFAQLVMMNLFIMIIVENFDNLNSKKDNGQLEFDTMFRAVWEIFDPEGTGRIYIRDLEEFLKRLPSRYGLRRDATNSQYIRILSQLGLHVWLEADPDDPSKLLKVIKFRELLVALHRRVRHSDIGPDVLSTLKVTPSHVKDNIIRGAKGRRVFSKSKAKKAPETAAAMVADEFAARSIVRIFRRWRRYNKNNRSRSPVPEIEGIKNPSKKIVVINQTLIDEHIKVGDLSSQITDIESRLGSSSPGRRSSIFKSGTKTNYVNSPSSW